MSRDLTVRLNGAVLRLLRRRLHLTQQDLAEILGVYQPYISDLERGIVVHVYPATLDALAEALGVTMEELVGEQRPGG